MPLSKEFYLDEIRSKHPNSYNESLKDLPVKDLADMLDFLDEALGKADGGAIGIEVLFTDKKPRENFFMGGPALTGEALSIYNSMNAYGFSDQEIANALAERGLYAAAGSGTTQPEQVTGIINQQIKDADNPTPPLNFFDKGFSSQNFNLGPNKDVVDYEAEAYKVGPTFKGQLSKAYMGLRSLPTPFNIASKAIGNISDFFKQKAIEKAQQKAAAEQAMLDAAYKQQTKTQQQAGGGGGGQFDGASSKAEYDSDPTGFSGSFKRGGLATMFKKKR